MRRLIALLALALPMPALAQQSVSGVYQSTKPTLTDGVQNQVLMDSRGSIDVNIRGADGAVGASVVTGAGDGGTNSIATLQVYAANRVYNGSTWDRQRGDLNGIIVQPGLSSTYWNYAAAASGIVNTTTAVTVKAAAGASVRNYIMSMQCSHDTLGAVTEFAIRDGAAGTVLYRGKLNTTATDMTGNTINFEPPLKGTANTLVEIVTLTAVTGGVYCNLQGYTGS